LGGAPGGDGGVGVAGFFYERVDFEEFFSRGRLIFFWGWGMGFYWVEVELRVD
jgi:hypothetical protein